MPSSPGFSFGQKWRGGRRVVERRSPGPALRGGGSMKSPDEGASVRWAMAASLDVVTTVVASFSESLLCGVAVGLAAFGHV
uniref:Uncharacterized protein n=1 Tax=Oryza glaberrima TaxID=4538 RepID=I1QIQ5_ORYGL